MVYAKGGTSQFSGGKGNVVKMNVYQEISQIIKEADGILIGASNGLSIAEGYNISGIRILRYANSTSLQVLPHFE